LLIKPSEVHSIRSARNREEPTKVHPACGSMWQLNKLNKSPPSWQRQPTMAAGRETFPSQNEMFSSCDCVVVACWTIANRLQLTEDRTEGKLSSKMLCTLFVLTGLIKDGEINMTDRLQ